MPSGSTRLTVAFLYSFPLIVLKSSASASDADSVAKTASVVFQCFMLRILPVLLCTRQRQNDTIALTFDNFGKNVLDCAQNPGPQSQPVRLSKCARCDARSVAAPCHLLRDHRLKFAASFSICLTNSLVKRKPFVIPRVSPIVSA